MDNTFTLSLNPLFNYKEFYDKQILCDCVLIVESEDDEPVVLGEIKAHSVVLANGSTFFFNIFTGGLEESRSGEIHYKSKNLKLIKKVIDFLYTGNLPFEQKDLMMLYHIASDFEVQSLTQMLTDYMKSVFSSSNVLFFVNQCYENELIQELKDIMEDYIATFYRSLSIANMTQALDVITFTHVLLKIAPKEEDSFKALSEFIGNDYICDDEEKRACASLFSKKDKNVVAKLKNVSWLPNGFV